MEFRKEKCAMLVRNKGKRETIDGIKKASKNLREKENCKYLGILEAYMKQTEMKEKVRKEYLRRTRKLLETKL